MVPRPPQLPHDVSPFLQVFREFLLGRPHNSRLRFPERIAARTQPPPELPDGCNSKLFNNHYCTRDGRRLIQPNDVIFQSTGGQKTIAAASLSKPSKSDGALTLTEKKPKTPGKTYLPPVQYYQ